MLKNTLLGAAGRRRIRLRTLARRAAGARRGASKQAGGDPLRRLRGPAPGPCLPAVLAALALLPSPAARAGVPADLLVPRLLADETYSEGWEQLVRFADGSLLAAHFMITNLGPGSHRGIVIATLTLPDGRSLLIKNGRPRKAWQPLSGPTGLGIARHRLERRADGYRLRLKNSVAEVELRFRPTLPPWDLGRLWTDRGVGRYQDVYYYAPRLVAEGRYRPGPASGGSDDGPWRPLAGGRGYALRYVNSTGAHRLLRHRLRLTSLDDGPEAVTGELVVTLGGGLRGRLARWRDGRRVWDRPLERLQRVPRNGDRPLAEAELAGPGLRLRLEAPRLLQRFDVLARMGLLERLLIGAYSRPVERRYLARARLQGPGGGAWQGRVLLEEVAVHPREEEARRLQLPPFAQIVGPRGGHPASAAGPAPPILAFLPRH